MCLCICVCAGAVVSNGLSASGHTQAAQDFVDDQEQRGGRAAPQHVRLRRRQRQVAVCWRQKQNWRADVGRWRLRAQKVRDVISWWCLMAVLACDVYIPQPLSLLLDIVPNDVTFCTVIDLFKHTYAYVHLSMCVLVVVFNVLHFHWRQDLIFPAQVQCTRTSANMNYHFTVQLNWLQTQLCWFNAQGKC